MISQARLQQLQSMLADGTSNRFYDWPEWDQVRAQVMALDHWECQRCREYRRYRRADLVHHVKHLKDRPDLALSIFDDVTGERQLLSVCRPCHEALYPERGWRRPVKQTVFVTPERWD